MIITTVHTLAFGTVCRGNDQHLAAMSMIKAAAEQFEVKPVIKALPLGEGVDPTIRSSVISIEFSDLDRCNIFRNEIDRTLAFVGVEITSYP